MENDTPQNSWRPLKSQGPLLRSSRGKPVFPRLGTQIVSFQSISDLNGAIASLADWGNKISCEFFEIKLKKFRKSMKHKGLVSNPCSKSAPRQGLSAELYGGTRQLQIGRKSLEILHKTTYYPSLTLKTCFTMPSKVPE